MTNLIPSSYIQIRDTLDEAVTLYRTYFLHLIRVAMLVITPLLILHQSTVTWLRFSGVVQTILFVLAFAPSLASLTLSLHIRMPASKQNRRKRSEDLRQWLQLVGAQRILPIIPSKRGSATITRCPASKYYAATGRQS